jgi:[acyl-carrier-protein] S-malonyltransferase
VSIVYVLYGMADHPGLGTELYERFDYVRDWYAAIENWTGLTAREIFAAPLLPENGYARQSLGPLRQAAATIAAYDVLAGYEIRPDAICGVSIGALVGGCLSGAVGRRDFIELLAYMRTAPPPGDGAPPEGTALLTVPAEHDLGDYLRPGVYLAVDSGVVRRGKVKMRIATLGGYRSALQELATELSPGVLRVLDFPLASHTPLQQSMSEYLAPRLARLPVRHPEVRLWTCAGSAPVTTADGVRDMYLRNPVQTVYLEHLPASLRAEQARLALIVGPSSRRLDHGWLTVPAVHVETPEHVVEAVTAVHELAVSPIDKGTRS